MGRRPIVRKRGSSPKYRAHSIIRVAPSKYPQVNPADTVTKGRVLQLVHDPGRGAPLALIELENKVKFFTLASEGTYVGQEVEVGKKTPVKLGNILTLAEMPEGTYVCNVERKPGDGGALFRSSGNYAVIIGKSGGMVTLKDAKGRLFLIKGDSLATVGIVAGGGRTEKPFLKAGNKLKLMRSKGRRYPIVRGVAMAAVHHPHGGGRHQHVGGSTSISRRLSPGAKVGLISPKRTGR
ncbi:MAG: 50S ribosomal protein L2 [Thermoproteota archaeon]